MNINFTDDLISSYSYMVTGENIEEICNMIAAFGTGIASFEIIDISEDQMISHIPQKGQKE